MNDINSGDNRPQDATPDTSGDTLADVLVDALINAPDDAPVESEEPPDEPEAGAAGESTDDATTEVQAEVTEEPTAEEKIETPATPAKKKGFFRRLGAVRIAILIVLAAVLGYSVYMLVDDQLQDNAGENLYKEIEQVYLSTPSATPPLITPTPIPSPPMPSGTPEIIIDEPPEESPEASEKPIVIVENFAPDIWPDVDWDGLNARNPDTAAWLLCPGTNINYPVVYSSDNNEYLTTMFDGNYSKVGTLFVDMRNSKGFTDRNTVIHGHNMRNHSMFWTLTQYKSQWFYNSHPTMRLITPEGKFEIQLFAGIVADSINGFDFWKVKFRNDEAFMDWVGLLYENSTFKSNVEVTADDKLVMMSTCSYEYKSARYIAVGKLVAVS